ncbi:MAG TPA: bifunctional serine/threonine-protein kinase/universal stress protein [Pseudolabrys sp.]|jgi:serine/threonine protein kinase
MVKPLHEPGVIIDGFRLEERVHIGGMATLWRVSRPGTTTPMLMKVPKIGEGADPAAIVSFEMEQMILPRLSGVHVPRFIAAGDFAVRPYIVMEAIPGTTLLPRLAELPLPYAEVANIGVKIAQALDDLHRQHVVHLDVKPSNIMFRPTGEAVLLDFGLSHHDRLPDLMQEEFRLPFGTAPYMSPEQLRGIRNDPRSDLFALGVLLYFFSTGVRPFGESETLRGMRRRLWRDPVPPRRLRSDYPPWLQEIVLRCLEIEPGWRYPTAAQVAFDLTHHDEVKLTARSERSRRDPFTTVLRRRFNYDLRRPRTKQALDAQISSAPIVAVAIDLAEGSAPLNDALRVTAGRILATLPSARLACLNVLKQSRLTIDFTLDEQGHNRQIDRLVRLRHWAEPLKLEEPSLTVHVLEAIDPAAAILEFARNNRIDHILIGARQNSLLRTLLGSVSAKVAAEAQCTVTVVRPNLTAEEEKSSSAAAPSSSSAA